MIWRCSIKELSRDYLEDSRAAEAPVASFLPILSVTAEPAESGLGSLLV